MSEYIMPNSTFDSQIDALMQRAMHIAEIAQHELKTPESMLCADDEALHRINMMFKDLNHRLETIQLNALELAVVIEGLKIENRKTDQGIYG